MFRLRIVSVVLCFDFILEFFKQKFSVFVRLCCLSVQFSWFFPVFVDSVSPIIHITKIDLKTKKKKKRKEKLHRWRVLKHKTKGGAFITSTQFQAEARLFSLRNWALTLSLKYQGLLSLEKEIIQAHRKIIIQKSLPGLKTVWNWEKKYNEQKKREIWIFQNQHYRRSSLALLKYLREEQFIFTTRRRSMAVLMP